MKIICSFHNGYFDCRGSFQTVVDMYCCIIAGNEASSFQMMADIIVRCGAMVLMQYVWVHQ